MSKTRDNSPELDYFELRRRHEEYKRAKNAPQAEKNSVEERLERQVAQRKARPEIAVQEAPVSDVQDELKVEAKAAPMDAFEEAIEENYEAYDDDMDYDADAEEDAANPNPFDSFIRFFNGMKSNLSSRRDKGDELEELDLDDLTDEELAELEAEGLLDEDEEFNEVEVSPAKPRFGLRRSAQPDVDGDEDEIAPAADIEDIDESPRPARRAAVRHEEPGADFEDEDFDDENFEDLEEEDLPRKSGFKKFVNLFVTRVDEDEEFDEEEYEDEELEELDFDDDGEIEEIEVEEAPVRKGFFARGRKNKARRIDEDEEVYDDLAHEIQIRPEGGLGKMDEMNKLAPETTAQAAGETETSGMTRRERRERAMRLAAEEAARKAEEEARAKATAVPVEPLFTDLEAKEAPVDMAAFENAPETDLIVETTAEEITETVDEPTREFTPVSMRDVQIAAEKALFDVDDEDDEDFDDEDEDDEDEIVEKKPRRGLFGRKRAKDEEEDDFDDEDEDYDDEDEDDEDEIVEKKPRCGLFGRKRAKDEEEDDYDEDEDEDDEDLDDEYGDDEDAYDAYDDDDEDGYDEDDDEYDDDDYDEDDDEPRRSFGHHLIGVFKVILGLILVLLVLVIGLNFHHFITGENAIVTKAYEVLGDSAAADVLCFGYVMREAMPAEEAAAPEAAIEAEITAEPTALPQAEAAIPNLDNNGVIAETPVVEAAPVIEAAPAVEEAPVVQQAPVTSGSVG